MKRPSFQFYPGDWLRDTALRTCSIGARGLWIDMICFMHEGNPYGHLKVNQKVILPANLAVMCGATLQDIEGWLGELSSAGVFEKTEDETIYSKRMIRDEIIREARAAGGKLGGNPMLIEAHKVNHTANLTSATEVNSNLTPSSSSSSSSLSSKKQKKTSIPMPAGMNEEIWQDFLSTRVKAITQTGLNGIAKQAVLAGISLEAALQECCTRGWQSFKAEWINKTQGAGNGKFNIHAAGRESLARALAEEAMGARAPWEVQDAVHEPVQQLLPRSSDD